MIWPLAVGPARAKQYLLTGDALTAAEAERSASSTGSWHPTSCPMRLLGSQSCSRPADLWRSVTPSSHADDDGHDRGRPRAERTSSCRDGDSLSCSMAVTGGPVENEPADGERSPADLPALADRLAAGHRKEACQRRCGRGPRPQTRPARPVPQVA